MHPLLPFLLQKSALRRKWAACKIVVHNACMEQLEKVRYCHLLEPDADNTH